MYNIIKKIKLMLAPNKCCYCGCNIYSDDKYCSYRCTINDNKDAIAHRTHD